MEELVLDCALRQANQLYSQGAAAMFRYLKGVYNGRWQAVRALRTLIMSTGGKVPPVDSSDEDAVIGERVRIYHWEFWALEELTYKRKQREVAAMYGHPGEMLVYLKRYYGIGEHGLLVALRMAAQRPRRKTLGSHGSGVTTPNTPGVDKGRGIPQKRLERRKRG